MMEELGPGAYVTPSVRLVRPLAQGGMGTVWVAQHLVLDTEVVVKLMSRGIDAIDGASARFAREAAVAAAVKSPHVVQVFDSGVTEQGIAYIVMELLEGHDLGVHLAARGRMSPHDAKMLVTQLAKALAKAHRVGIVHRDIKPDNIFLCDVEGGEPFVKLLDFGTAKDEARAPHATTAGQLLGTPYYMSPEQILGEAVDYRTDIWSLGVLAFEALTGARPFEGATVGAITLSIHTTQPRMTDVAPELPPALDEWFSRTCARDPADRFQSVKAAGEAFARAISGEAPDSVLPESDPLSLTPSVPSSTAPPAGGMRTVQTPSERVATSLSSTLHSPRAERRTMTWIAGGVGVATIAAMFALLMQDEPRSTSSATPTSATTTASASSANANANAGSPAASANAPSPSAVLASAAAANAAPSAMPAASPFPSTPPAASGSSVSPASSASSSTASAASAASARGKDAAPARLAPLSSGASGAATAPTTTARPSSSASPLLPRPAGTTTAVPTLPGAPPSPSAPPSSSAPPSPSAPTSEPSSAPPPASTPAPAPAEPAPTAPLDLKDLLPPATPSQ